MVGAVAVALAVGLVTGRSDRRSGRQAAPTTRVCFSTPLSGSVWFPSRRGTVAGTIRGLPVSTFAAVADDRDRIAITGRSDGAGTMRISGPWFTRRPIDHARVLVGTTTADATRYGPPGAPCHTQLPLVTDPCVLLSRRDIETAVGAQVGRAQGTSTIGGQASACSWPTSSPEGVVFVSLIDRATAGKRPLASTGSAVFFDGGQRRGYVLVGVQYGTSRTGRLTQQLARITRAYLNEQ